MKLNRIAMEDALECIIDYRGKTPIKSNSGIVTLSAKSVRNGFIDYSSCYHISEEEYRKYMVRGFPHIGDVLLTTEAPLGVVARLDRDHVALAQRLLTLRGKKGVLDTCFLYYYLKSPAGQAKLKERESGTTVTGIKQSEFRRIEIEIPDYAIQEKIAQILNSMDRKILLNREINKNLSDQLQALYSSEFDPMMYPVTGKLSDICHYSSERVNVDQLTTKTYYSTENMQPNKASAVEAANLPNIKQTTKCHAGDVLVSNIRPYFKKIEYVTTACGCSADVLCFVPESNELSAFLYETVYGDRFFDYMVAGSKGTKMPRGDKQQIMQYGIVMPSPEQLSAFNAIATPMLALIGNQVLENERLSTLRDSLLPKLVSGEIDVSGIEL